MNSYAVKSENVLHPTPEAVEKFNRIPQGAIVHWTYRRPQIAAFHRKFFAMISVIFDNQSEYNNKDLFYKVLIMLSGFCEIVQVGDKTLFVADSVSFEKCSQSKLEEIYDKVLDVALERFCVGSSVEEINKKVDEVLAFS
jgi:hypothetical protein